MGSNNNQGGAYSGYGPNPGRSGGDPRGRVQNANQYAQGRYENQQGPMASAMGFNYGRGTEADYGNYTDIMNMYRGIAGGGGAGGGGGGAGYSPSFVSYTDPFNSYGGFTRFSQTGGYSPQDMANLRARGVSPIRAAYANAEREIGRQRSLQGGYSPNAIAARVKMAREQGQGMADAVQNVEGGIVDQRNRNMLSGLQGMFGVEGQRLGAQLDAGKFNASAANQAAAFGASASNSASQAAAANQMRALQGMASLYGTTPGMSAMFGNQLLGAVGQGGQMGQGYVGNEMNAQRLPGAWDTWMGRAGDIYGMGSTIAYPWLNQGGSRPGGGGYGASGPSPVPGFE